MLRAGEELHGRGGRAEPLALVRGPARAQDAEGDVRELALVEARGGGGPGPVDDGTDGSARADPDPIPRGGFSHEHGVPDAAVRVGGDDAADDGDVRAREGGAQRAEEIGAIDAPELDLRQPRGGVLVAQLDGERIARGVAELARDARRCGRGGRRRGGGGGAGERAARGAAVERVVTHDRIAPERVDERLLLRHLLRPEPPANHAGDPAVVRVHARVHRAPRAAPGADLSPGHPRRSVPVRHPGLQGGPRRPRCRLARREQRRLRFFAPRRRSRTAPAPGFATRAT